jgi:hypothetical protein
MNLESNISDCEGKFCKLKGNVVSMFSSNAGSLRFAGANVTGRGDKFWGARLQH